MIENDNVCFLLDEFERNIKTSWHKLQNEEDLFDVTLACEDKQIKTHKIIISSCSPVLKNILKVSNPPA